MLKLNSQCKRCDSAKTILCGTDKLGQQRYKCKECDYRFVCTSKRRGRVADPRNPDCVKCQSKHVSKIGFSALGDQRYSCGDCKYRFVIKPSNAGACYLRPLFAGFCIYCNSKKVSKAGLNRHNLDNIVQKYACKDCGRRWSDPTH